LTARSGDSTIVLGIDIQNETLRIAFLQERGKGFVLRQAIEVSLGEEQRKNPSLLGQALEETFLREEWQSRRAYYTLHDAPGLIKRLPAEMLRTLSIRHPSEHLSKSEMDSLLRQAQQSLLLPAEDLVFDVWFGNAEATEGNEYDGSTSLCAALAAMPNSAVEFCRQAAGATSVRAAGLTMRSLAKINSLWFQWGQSTIFPFAVIFAEEEQTDVAILDSAGIVSVQTILMASRENGEGHPETFGRELQRILNVSQLSSGSPIPKRFYLGGSIAEGRLHALSEEIRKIFRTTEIRVCGQPEELTIAPGLGDFEKNRNYLAAIGAALEGLSACPVGFNFLHPRGMRKEKRKPLSWRPAIFGCLAIVLLVASYWFTQLQKRKAHLNYVDAQYSEAEPILAKRAEAQKNWNLVRSFLPPEKNGGRQEYLKILYEITRLFPDTKDAYLTELTIYGPGRTGGIGEADIVITGKVRQGEVLTEFIDRLNGSEMIRQAERAGSLMQEPGDTLYPFIFSVTCNLRQPAEGARR